MTAPVPAALALLAGVVVLIGCAGSQPEREQAALDHALRDMAAAQAGLEAMRRGVAPYEVAPRPILPAAARTGLARSPRSANDLAGLTDGELRAVMGDPDLVRDEGEAQAWLYRGPSCLLDVFLEGESEPRVVLATARAAGLNRVPEEVCLRALSRARARLW
ncbi:hypothetical protein [Elioraea sp.]|jgi:hypothetical protein|uniref:hypothetical protein n=1 Tax=Elioraea sp. TaxID=2185103 RepID=UPI003F71025F